MYPGITFYLFGDQSDDARTYLRVLLQRESDPLLCCFLRESLDAIQTELSRVPSAQNRPVQRFSSFLDLLSLRNDGAPTLALDHAITVICHFALFFRRCHQAQGLYPQSLDSFLIGMCTGSLAVAAISCCRTLSELLPVAVQVVILSLRAGTLAADIRARLQADSDPESSWALMFPGLTAARANAVLNEFSESGKLPIASRPYVSNRSLRGVTICGPPIYLSRLRKSEGLRDTNAVSLPIYAPYHAPHLYSSKDIQSLLDATPVLQWSFPYRNLPILSSAFGGEFQAVDLRHGLYNALSDIFLKPMDWQSTICAVLSAVKMFKNVKATVVPLPSAAAPSLCEALVSSGGIDVEIESSLFQPSDDLPSLATYSELASATTQNKSQSKIAIVGMSGRFPSANDATEFWDILYKGLDVHKIVPPIRWSAKTHVDISGKRKNTSAIPYGCWLDEAGLFDARFFGMSPREAVQVDPAQRLALMTAYEALEQGGIVPDSTPSMRRDRVGVSYGVTSNDWMETNSAQAVDTYFIPGGNRAFIPGRINYYFKFSGPSYAIDTACSSSLAAIHIACNALWRGEADTMIAGGTNVLTNPDFTAGLDRGHFLSRTGNCKTFDDQADGYCRGEGVGTVILKRLEDALTDNDPIQGVILNICTNHSAEAESITRPHLGAQKAIFHSVLNGLDPINVSYIEMHGTGTQFGDATEMSSVLEAFAPSSGHQRRLESHPLYVGSVKANVGHGEAAAGVTGLAKLLLMMQHNTIPPHCGIKSRINHRFPTDLSARGVHIARKPLKWVKPSKGPRRALLNNFSAAGGNTTLLLEDAPRRDLHDGSDSRSTHLIVISAKDSLSLKANARSLLSFIRRNHTVPLSLSSLSYTTTARRVHHPHRIAVTGSSLEEIATSLSQAIEFETGKTRAISGPEVIFAFTGQGSHFLGMGKEFYDNIASFRADISRYDQIARNQGFSPFIHMITDNEGDIATCSPMITQLATTCLQMALVRLWASWGVVPRSVIGHSLGLYASLNAAGVLSEADTIYLVGTRVRQLEEKCRLGTHMMLAVKAPVSTITCFLDCTGVEVACINGPDDTVLSGPREEIEAVYLRLASQGVKAISLNIPYAFHSSQVDCVLEDFRSAAHGAVFRRPSIPVICPLTVSVICKDEIFGPDHLSHHYRNCVNMVGALEAATRDGLVTRNTTFVEIGHNSTVSAMLRANLNAQHQILPSLRRNQNPWKTLADALSILYMAGAEIDWKEYHRDFTAYQQVISLPHYNWDLKDYWIQYVHDWSLRKGDPPHINSSFGPRILSSTIHEVVSEEVEDMTGTVVLQSDLSRSDLHPIVQGHKVNGIPLCTPSIYADIALSIGEYLREKYKPEMKESQITVAGMTIEKALVPQSKGPQYLRISVEVELPERRAQCQFLSVNDEANTIVHHASCTVLYFRPPDAQWLRDRATETKLQIALLRQGLATDRCYKFNRTMIYRMVATLAEFDKDYRGLKEIVLDNEAMAAATKIDFSRVNRMADATFHTNPAYIDAFSQSGGFVMNANVNSDLELECFVNHGWGSLQLYEALKPDETYESYVQMAKKEGSIWQGTLTVIQDDKVIGVFEDITFQGVPRRLLHHILSSANKQQARTKSPANDNSTESAISEHIQRQIQTSSILTENVGSDDMSVRIEKMLNIVSEESGIDRAELHDSTNFGHIGVDSLLSLIITSRFREELNFDIGSGYSIFDQFRTLGQLKVGLAESLGLTITPISESQTTESKATPDTSSPPHFPHSESTLLKPSPPLRETSSPRSEPTNSSPPALHQPPIARPCTSVILQGSSPSLPPKNPSRTLFLFPDGSGSASSYASLPPISPTLTLIALICPYRLHPSSMTCTLSSLISSYVAEIRRRQPHGPYSLGGWSSGGVLAYRATNSLVQMGEEVERLVLIDAPDPSKGLERLPDPLYKHCSEVGVFSQIGDGAGDSEFRNATSVPAAGGGGGGGGAVAPKHPPDWLIPHFKATVELISTYHAPPLRLPPGMSPPRMSVCWAGRAALDGVRFAKMELWEDRGKGEGEGNRGVRFLTEKRTEVGAGGWAELIPGEGGVRVEVLGGWDHFGIMYGEGAKALAGFIRRAIGVEEEGDEVG